MPSILREVGETFSTLAKGFSVTFKNMFRKTVTEAAGRPVFLKIVYHGPKAMEDLVSYDPSLVAGILGGSSGTTHDAFKLLEEADEKDERHCAQQNQKWLLYIAYHRLLKWSRRR